MSDYNSDSEQKPISSQQYHHSGEQKEMNWRNYQQLNPVKPVPKDEKHLDFDDQDQSSHLRSKGLLPNQDEDHDDEDDGDDNDDNEDENQEDDENEDDDDYSEDQDNEDSDASQQSDGFMNRPQKIIQQAILEQLRPLQIKGKFRDKICLDIQKRMEQDQEDIDSKTPQQAIQIRSIQLAKAKILVLVHDWSSFRLVIAETQLGAAYIDYQCYQQAEQHLNIALKRNKQFSNEKDKAKVYQAYILTLLAKCNYQRKDYHMGIDNLQLARDIQINYPKQQISSFKTLMLMSNCYSKIKEYENADQTIDQLLKSIYDETNGQSTQYAFAYVEKAKIKSLKEQHKEAEEYQNKAIVLLINLNYKRPEYVSDAYQVLSQYQEKNKNVEEQINSLNKAKTIIEEVCSTQDKRVVKLKRQIAIILLNNGRNNEAIKQLTQILELERKVYGESSLAVGKTNKLLGNVYLKLKMIEESKAYLKDAQKILNEKKTQKSTDEKNRSKLRYVKEIRQNKKLGTKKIIKN